jgi:hypothetical protein
LKTALENAAYQSEFTQSGEVTLENGVYSEEAAPGSAGQVRVSLTDTIVSGISSAGQPMTAVVLISNSGGSGTFYTLHVMEPQDGLVNTASILLGDRVQINSMEIVNGQIVVDMVQAGPNDPLCCPTQHVVNTYDRQGDQLILVNSAVVFDN